MDEISGIKEELIDRYGKLPDEVSNLLMKIVFKVLAIKAGIKKLDVAGKQLVLHLSHQHQANPHGIVDLNVSEKKRLRLTPDHTLTVTLSDGRKRGLLTQTKFMLTEISHHVNALSQYSNVSFLSEISII